jgi:hypothetical protein
VPGEVAAQRAIARWRALTGYRTSPILPIRVCPRDHEF